MEDIINSVNWDLVPTIIVGVMLGNILSKVVDEHTFLSTLAKNRKIKKAGKYKSKYDKIMSSLDRDD